MGVCVHRDLPTGGSAGGARPIRGDQPEAAAVTPDPWPKTIEQDGTTYTLYQPQLDSWDGHTIAAHAAVSVRPAGAQEPDFGVIEITAQTYVSRPSRTVDFADIVVTKATFPATPDKAAGYQQTFQTMIAGGPSTMSLDRLQALLSIESAQQLAQAVGAKRATPVRLRTAHRRARCHPWRRCGAR